MRTRILHSLSEIDRSRWNVVADRGGLQCRHEFLLAVEQSHVNDCRHRYPVVEDDKGVAGCCSCCAIATELDTFARGMTKRVIGWIRRIDSDAFILKTVECGCPVALGNTVCVREGVDHVEVLRLLASAMERVANELDVDTIVWRDFQENELPLFDVLLEMGYKRVRNLPEARLEIRWKSFEEYLSSMRSPFRCSVRSVQRKLVGAGGRVELLNDYGGLEVTFARLWRNAYDRAKEYRREVLMPAFFENMRRHLPGAVAAVVAFVKEAVAGFLLLLRDGRTMTTLFSGLDYAMSREAGVYFCMFHKAIEVAIAEGFKEINFGLTTLDPKLDLGARVAPVHIYMKSKCPIVGPVMPRLFSAMTPVPRRFGRNVFRDAL